MAKDSKKLNKKMAKKAKQPATKQQVKSRLVLNFPGFEPTDSAAQLGRLNYAAQNTGKIWGFDTVQSEPTKNQASHHSIVTHKTTGPNWGTTTRIVQFRWNDIVHEYEKTPFPIGFLKSSLKYFSFFTDGTIFSYFKTSPRYWGFTIFPILLIAIFALVSWFFLSFLPLGTLTQISFTAIITLAFCKIFGKKSYLLTTIADWHFARDMVDRNNKATEERFSEFSKTVINEIKSTKADEIVVVGHSFGALWAIAAIAQALEKQPKLLANKKITFLALGSSILKIALSPNAKFMRDYWNNVTAQKNIFWHEIQTKDDWIAFYKCDPFELPQFNKPKGGYIIDRIKFKDGMDKQRYDKMRRSFYTTHRQYILYYDQRVHFDYMLRILGPFNAQNLAFNHELNTSIDHSGKLV